MYLPETAGALNEAMANNQFGPGAHAFANSRPGVGGLFLGEVPFDPSFHEAADILTTSFMEDLTEQPHVGLYRPEHPLHVSVVTDYGNAADDARIIRLKREAARNLTDGIVAQLGSVTDRLDTFAVGATDTTDLGIYEHDLAGRASTEIERAEDIAHISLSGLTVVISDFRNLPLDQMGRNRFQETLAVKVNHPFEREIPSGVGVLSLRGMAEVNTNKPRELDRVNKRLAELHRQKIEALEDAGIPVASVVIRPQMPLKLDETEVDQALSDGLRTLMLK